MKLADHVDHLRELIEAAFDKQFARLGFGKNKQIDIEKLPEEVKSKRERFVTMLENHIGETGDYQQAREKLLDELTFTLFNRLAAIKVMEAASLFPPILTKQIEHGDRSFGHKAWLEMNPHMRDEELEGIHDYLKTAFNELGQTLPLYSKIYPYALLPDAVSLNDIIDAFNAVEKDGQVGSEIWLSDDVLGWMYESYNNKKKQDHKDSKAKTEYNKVSLQSQVYTPRWVVQFLVENSLGKMYLEMYPQSEIKQRFKIANAPTKQTRTPKPLHEVRTIDPACGSGNFLLYAFDFYYELYLDQIENYGAEYKEKDIPKLIIENNLHGIDLDDRAIQLAQLGLFIKAKKKRRNIGELNFRVVSSDFYLPEYSEVRHIFEQGSGIERNQQELIKKIWGDLRYAYKFGSLVHIDEQLNKQLHAIEERAVDDLFASADLSEHKDFAKNFFRNLTTAVEQYARTGSNTFLSSKTLDAILFLELLTTKYDLATANPPYTPSGDYGETLKEYINNNYRKPYDTYVNLYSCFIQRIDQLLAEFGKIAMITPMTFMFTSTFEGTRKLILSQYHINLFVQYGFGGIFSVSVDPAMFVLEKGESNQDSTFIKLDMYFSESKKVHFDTAYADYLNSKSNKHVYKLNQQKIYEITSHPFIFWISQNFREKFKNNLLDDYVKICVGLQTGENERFLRFWWELSDQASTVDPEWISYAKGGAFNKWQGNLWLRVNWKNDGYEIKNFFGGNGRLKSRPQNEKFYLHEGITYSASGRGGYAFRYLPAGHIFDVGGSSIFPVKKYKNFNYLLAFLNSKLAFYIADCLNPTANIQVGDLKRVPFVIPDNINEDLISRLAQQNIELTEKNLKYRLVESTFINSIFSPQMQWYEAIKKYLIDNVANKTLILLNEALINKKIFDIYSLSPEDITLVTSKQGQDVAIQPVSAVGKKFFIEYFCENINENTLNFLNDLPVCDDREEFKDVIDSLVKGADIEDISKRFLINPVDILLILTKCNLVGLSTGIVQDIAFEFLVDIVRNCLMQDEDGIISLVPNSGEKILYDRIEEKFIEQGYSSAQFSSFESMLGISINKYFEKNFFSKLTDYLNLFSYLPKTPFIWHLTSGPEQGFDCYIIIYKWSRDNLMRLRSVYIENRERALQNRQSDLAGNESADAQNEKERIFKQLKEIESFKKKIDELLTEGYNPILDDGVGKNIAHLQKNKMLPYEVLNDGQLKKYLNADW